MRLNLAGVCPVSLDDLDRECESFLMTLPVSKMEQSKMNIAFLCVCLAPCVLEMIIWPVFARFGWKSTVLLFTVACLMSGSAYRVRRLSKKWFIPSFLIVILLVSWLAETLNSKFTEK